jgi:hypothetical protein
MTQDQIEQWKDAAIAKLEKIKAKCRANLALAEKRTPGRWVFSQDYGDGRTQVVHTDEDEPWFLVEETHGAPHPKRNAAFIAACAGAAEAGWKATIAAIDSIQSPQGLDYRLCQAILDAWK